MANEVKSLNRVRYSGFDFETINDELLNRLQVEFLADYNDFALSSLGMVLLDSQSFGLDALSFYLDRRATEAYLGTARTRDSVARLARQLGYKMGGSVAASTDLVVSLADVWPFAVPVPRGFQFTSTNGLVFEVAEDVIFPLNATEPQSIPVYEGETISETFVSTGLPNQVFEITSVPSNKVIVQGSARVLVNGSLWVEADILSINATDQYELSPNEDPPRLRFGNGESGNIPVVDASIVLTYIASSGLAGNVAANTITDVVEPLVVLGNSIGLVITNPTKAVGGDDRESIERVRFLAPQLLKSRGVTVTASDYEAVAGSFSDPTSGRVAIAKAISSRTGGTDLTLQNLLIDINAAATSGQPVIEAGTTAISGYVTTIEAALQTTPVTNTTLRLTDIASDLLSVNNQQQSATSALRAAQREGVVIAESTSEINLRTGSADANASAVLTQLSTIPTASPDQLTQTTRDSISNSINNIRSELSRVLTQNTTVISASGTIQTGITNALNALGLIADQLSDVGTDLITPSTYLNDLSVNNTAVLAAAAGIQSESDLLAVTTAVAVDDISTATLAITQHVSSYLSSDCKANLITVPILTKNAAGFFDAPSNALINKLQLKLAETKEVSQTVIVTSGENALVPAVIDIFVGVRSGYSERVVAKVILAAIDGLLRNRRFGVGLYESDVDRVMRDVAGAVYWTVRIRGHYDRISGLTTSSLVDANGNLVVSDSYVITKADYRNTTVTPFVDGIQITTELAVV